MPLYQACAQEMLMSTPAERMSSPRSPHAFTTLPAVPYSGFRDPSLPPNSIADIRPRPRMSTIGYFSNSGTKPCTNEIAVRKGADA